MKRVSASAQDVVALHEKLKKETPSKRQIAVNKALGVSSSPKEPTAMEKGKAKAKEHKEKLKKLADNFPNTFKKGKEKLEKLGRKSVGYVKGWVGKKKGGKVKRGCANGGTVVMPTVGNDVRVRAYKQGALIHPRPRPTTVLHGRARGVGIAKRGW